MDTSKNILETLQSGAHDWAIFACLTIILSTFFILLLSLSIFLRGYGRAKRAWFLFVSAGIFLLERALLLKSPNGQTLSYVTLSISAFFYAIIFAIRVRRQKPTKEQKELARFIDRQLSGDLGKDKPIIFKDVRIGDDLASHSILDDTKECQNRCNGEYGVDFEHVKSVIDKLEYYGLNQSDKKQVQELSYALDQAKNHGFSPLVKSKINDGLGALLKIMSKYGV